VTLSLKYRPKRFEDLIGQEPIVQTLTLALDTKQLGHAYLFSGLRGSGKTSTARIFAKALLCQEGPTSNPCEECEDCRAANEGRHIDIVEMDAASNRKIDDIRELIEHTRYKPAQGRYKIFIIDEVHMLTKEAFNALLKTLEEPPEYVKFILATTDPMKLPATILSRTQHFRFKKIPHQAIVHHLQQILATEEIPYELQALEILARSGQGSLRDTLTLLDQAIVYSKGHLHTAKVVEMLGLIDPQQIQALWEMVLSRNRQAITAFLQEAREYEAQMVLDELLHSLKEAILAQDPRIPPILQERFLRILSQAKELLFLSGDDESVLTLTLWKMVEATKLKEIDQLIQELEKAHPPTPSPAPRPKEQPTLFEADPKSRFQRLVDELYRRNYELGECFERSVTFVSFQNGVLTWRSHTPPECKEKLRLSYGTIKHLIKELFGLETKIQKIDDSPPEPQPQEPEPQGSCIAPTAPGELHEDILHTPLVQRAKELFRAKKIHIKQKV